MDNFFFIHHHHLRCRRRRRRHHLPCSFYRFLFTRPSQFKSTNNFLLFFIMTRADLCAHVFLLVYTIEIDILIHILFSRPLFFCNTSKSIRNEWFSSCNIHSNEFLWIDLAANNFRHHSTIHIVYVILFCNVANCATFFFHSIPILI